MPERHLDLLRDTWVEPDCGGDRQGLLLVVQHEDGGTIGVEDAADVREQLVEKLVHRLCGQARLQDRLQLVEPAPGVLGPAPGVLLALVQSRPLECLPALL